jgi:DNA replicative helicase MCM subunit Mcm2 (Cdc46/Mcm family)
MKFVRTYKACGSDHDPRQKKYAEFVCSSCGHIETFDVTANNTFDFVRERKCPKCKSFGDNDRIDNLKAEINRLTVTKNNIDVQIEKFEREIEELENKKNN